MLLAGRLGHGNLHLDFLRIEQAPDEIAGIRQERICDNTTDLTKCVIVEPNEATFPRTKTIDS